MSEQTIRIGIIGAGGNTTKRHLPGLLAQSGVELVSVANRSTESSQRVATEFAIPKVANHWQEIIADDSVDAVCIGTWPYMHEPMTVAALEAGKHVLVEARMARNCKEAEHMLAVSRAHPELVAQIVPAPHTLTFDRTIVDLISAGLIGELICADAWIPFAADFPQWDSLLHWRHDRDLSGNNIMNLGIWYEALMRWLGPARSVQALGQVVVKHRKDAGGRRTAISIPDHIDVLSQMDQGGQLHITVSSVVGLARPTEVLLHGTNGTICLMAEHQGGELALWVGERGNDSLKPVEITVEKRGQWRVEEEFVNAIRGLEPVTHTDFATGVRYMAWTDAVAQSLRTGERVQLAV